MDKSELDDLGIIDVSCFSNLYEKSMPNPIGAFQNTSILIEALKEKKEFENISETEIISRLFNDIKL